jgi:hypothetical protein
MFICFGGGWKKAQQENESKKETWLSYDLLISSKESKELCFSSFKQVHTFGESKDLRCA